MNQYLLKRLGWYTEKNTWANSMELLSYLWEIRALGDGYGAGAVFSMIRWNFKHLGLPLKYILSCAERNQESIGLYFIKISQGSSEIFNFKDTQHHHFPLTRILYNRRTKCVLPRTSISVISLRKFLWRCMGNRASTSTSSSFSLDDAEQTQLQIIHSKRAGVHFVITARALGESKP